MRRLMITTCLFFGAGAALAAAPSWIMEGEVATIDATATNENCSAGVQKVKIDFKTREVSVYCYGDYRLPPTKADKVEITTYNWLTTK